MRFSKLSFLHWLSSSLYLRRERKQTGLPAPSSIYEDLVITGCTYRRCPAMMCGPGAHAPDAIFDPPPYARRAVSYPQLQPGNAVFHVASCLTRDCIRAALSWQIPSLEFQRFCFDRIRESVFTQRGCAGKSKYFCSIIKIVNPSHLAVSS